MWRTPAAWWHAKRAWQKAAVLLLPVAVAALVLGVILDQRTTSSVAERPAAEVRPEVTDLSRGLIVFDGCSLVDDAGVAREDGMPAQVMALLPAGLDMKNLGVGGQTTQMMAADASTQVDPLYSASRPADILVCWEGTNDLILGTAPPLDARQAYRHLAAYCRARQRAGFRVVICTVLPRGRSAAFYKARNALNAELRAHWSTFADALADVAADQSIGAAGAESDVTYYRDTVHLTAAGYAIVAGVVAHAVEPLL
jgi:lysophospholipase L1-like esterase